jgi:hypothetical protein
VHNFVAPELQAAARDFPSIREIICREIIESQKNDASADRLCFFQAPENAAGFGRALGLIFDTERSPCSQGRCVTPLIGQFIRP